MKNCSECGQPYDDQFSFCPDDGGLLVPSRGVEAGSQGSAEEPTISEVISGASPHQPAARSHDGGPMADDRAAHTLRCPGCGTEYPQTFASCPIDGFKLSRVIRPASAPAYAPSNAEPDVETDVEAARPDDAPTTRPGSITQPLAAPEPAAQPEALAESDSVSTQTETGERYSRRFSVPLASFESAPRRRRAYFPRALIIILLAAIALAGLYLLTKGSGENRQKTLAQSADADSSFIETPQAARDFEEAVEEEAEEPVESATAQESEARSAAIAKNESEAAASASATGTRRAESPSAPAPQIDRQPAIQPERQGPSPEQIAAARLNEVARQASESRVNARLTRVRGRRTSAGYRYDLTFTLQSRSQLSLYWDKLLISTRSAKGTNNSMVVPFSHNLGADGSMTFTISVEMRGAAEADWQGRITCTSLGRDASGRLTRAAFSTSVAPG